MDTLGWDSCDVILVTGDAYVDHPSFGMAIVGRLLEAQGFRVGIIAQPDWHSTRDFLKLGRPNLFFGITGGNMDSMVNRYTSDRRIRTDDAYTPHGAGGARPDRCVIVYSQRCREAAKDVPIVIGGIEASLRRIAHFDYWSEKVRRSVLLDAKADLLVFGNAERQICEIAHRLAAGKPIESIDDLRGTAFVRKVAARGLDRDRLDDDRHAGAAGAAGRSVCDGADSGESLPPLADDAAAPRRAPARSPALPGEVVHAVDGGCGALMDRLTPSLPPPGPGEGAEIVLKFHRRLAEERPTASAALSACRRTKRWRTTPSCMRTPRASCTSKRIPGTRAPWCSATATPTCGSTRRRFRSRRRKWTRCTSCPTSACRTLLTATRRSPPTR